MTRLLLAQLAVGALVVAALSVPAARRRPSHAFWRFWAWLATLGLVVLNAPATAHPLGGWGVVSWVLVAASLVPMVLGVVALHRHGSVRTVPVAGGGPAAGAEQTTVLVDRGVYAWVRHPMYAGMLLLGWGVLVAAPSWPGLALAAVLTAALTKMARADELECRYRFGEAYRAYQVTTKRFVPYVW